MEIEALTEQVQKLEGVKEDASHDKRKYMEGAVWMGRRMSNEIERVCQRFEQLIQEYLRRFSQHEQSLSADPNRSPRQNTDLLNLQRAQIWLLETIKTNSFDLYERSITMIEGAIFHREDAEQRL